MQDTLRNMDREEIELPETVCIRDIETKVFQGIVLQALSKIEGIALLEGTILDSLLGRDIERVKGIYVEQQEKHRSLTIRIEINVCYGICIPEKGDEIQTVLAEELSRWTGLHVASIHVVFKGLVFPQKEEVLEEAF